jgi:hypothetical protein
MGIPQAAAPARRRSDAGHVRLQQRDLDGLLLLADHYAAPYDLLGQALGGPPARVRAITARWRAAGYAVTGVLGPGPAWCWLTAAGMAATGHAWPARPPSLSRLAHVRAVLAARLWLASSPAYADAGAWWRSERRIRAALPPPRVGTGGHVADAEVHWPSSEAASPRAGAVWAVEVELTPKPAARTARIMAGLLAQPRYAQVVYLAAPAARPRGNHQHGHVEGGPGNRGGARDQPRPRRRPPQPRRPPLPLPGPRPLP